MAGAIAHSRLRSLWDAIDNRKYKNALKLVSSLLVKHPENHYLLALKALALERTGKTDEALTFGLNAKEAGPVDHLTLSTLQIVFHRLNHLDLATSCYEYACLKVPNDVELLMGLFNCYAREYLYVKQQQTAMKMYKLDSKERFLMWAVCSIQLQVSCESGGMKLLSLAEALIKKHIDSHGLQALEAFLMYLTILEQQEKFDMALKALDGDLGKLFTIENDKLKLQGKLLIRANEHAAASIVLKRVLESCSDDWETFLHFLGCALRANLATEHLSCANSHLSTDSMSSFHAVLSVEEFDSRVSEVRDFVKRLQEQKLDGVKRGPFLAELEIEKHRIIIGMPDCNALCNVLLECFKRFGHLSSFVSDIEDYLKYIEPTEQNGFLSSLWGISSKGSLDNAVKALQSSITILQIEERFHLISSASDKDCLSRAIHFVKLFMENLYLSRDLDPQEVMHGEELLSMASNVLLQIFSRTKHYGYLFEAILILEFGLSLRRHIWQYRLALVHMYSYWDCMSCAFEWYKSLEIKNIMLESMSHHILPQLLKSPLFSELTMNLKEYMKFHEDYMKEAADLTLLVYQECNYTKVVEFIKFRERLQHSHHYLTVKIEDIISQIKQKLLNVEEVESILANLNSGNQPLQWSENAILFSLSYNEDLQTRPWWTPSPIECSFEEKVSDKKMNLDEHTRQMQLQRNLRRRCLIPRLLQLLLHCVNFLKETQETKIPCMENLCKEMKQLLEEYTVTLGISFDEASRVADSILAGQKSFKDTEIAMVDILSFAVFYNAWKLSVMVSDSEKENVILGSFRNTQRIIEISIHDLKHTVADAAKLNETMNTLLPAAVMPTLFQVLTEPISWHGLFLQSCIRALNPVGKRKKKSAAGSTVEVTSSRVLDALHTSVSSFRSVVESVQFWLVGYLQKSEDQRLDSLLSLILVEESGTSSAENALVKPGVVVKFLESSSTMVPNLGPRLGQAIEAWSLASVARKMITSQHKFISSTHTICASMLKAFKATSPSL